MVRGKTPSYQAETLWLRFAEDSSLPPVLDAAGQQKLSAIFAPDSHSLWNAALAALKFSEQSTVPFLSWYRHAPYINWSQMVRLVSGGSLRPVPDEQGFTYKESYRPLALWRMTKAQWAISRYVQDHTALHCPLPDDNAVKLVESLALGLCVLALTMRIPSKNTAMLHEGLADINVLPKTFRLVVDQIKAVQRRRNLLSPAWAVLFQQPVCPVVPADLPLFFWDSPPDKSPDNPLPQALAETAAETAPEIARQEQTLPTQWRGIPVAGTLATGQAFLVQTAADEAVVRASTERLVLVFPQARPETTELFPYAAAVLYGAGGALCHACSIAREQNVTCITGLGQAFIHDITAHLVRHPALIVQVDVGRKSVQLAPV